MTDIPPPEHPGWYADASGAWWWWDGAGWTPQVAPAQWGGAAPGAPGADHSQERTMAMVMWIIYLVGGGFIGALVFYFVGKDKRYVRHHAAEALNLTIALLVPQVVGIVLLLPTYIDLLRSTESTQADVDISAGFWVGLALVGVSALLSYALAVVGIVGTVKGRWTRLPILVHPVRGVVRKGEEPFDVRPS